MKKSFLYTCICIAFWSTTSMYAQEINTDSLSAVLYDTSKDTLARVEAAYQLALFNPGIEDPSEERVQWATDGLALARAIQAEQFYTRFLFTKGAIKILKYEEIPQAIELFEESIKYGPQAKIQRDFVFTFLFNTMVVSFESQTDLDSLISGARKEFDKIDLSPENNRLIDGMISTIYFRKRRFPEAIYWGNKVLNNPIPIKGNEVEIFYAYQISGEIYSELNQPEKAMQNIQRALEFANGSGYPTLVHHAHNSMTRILVQTKEYEKALVHIDSALAISPDCGCKNLKEFDLALKGNVLNKMGRYDEALENLEPLVSTDFSGVMEFHNFLGETYYQLGNYMKAINQVDHAIHPLVLLHEQRDAYEIKYKSWKAKGDFKKAFENLELFHQLSDSITTMQSEQRVVQLDMENQFAKEKLEREIDFQSQLNKQKATKNLLIALGIGTLLLALGLYQRLKFIRKTKRILQKKNEIIEAEKEKAQASERAKHQFLANMSHEIRTPMNAIKGMTDILIRRNPKDDQKEYLAGIKQSSESLLVIINDILDISKIEAGKIELENKPFSVNELVNNVHTIMQFKAEEKGLELKKDMPEATIKVNGDATRLRQILINLLSNAIKFTEKGVVTTTIKSEKTDEKLNLHVTVSDTGIGIDKDRLDKIFKSFEQAYSDTSRKFGGTGLGLSISKKLIELNNGKIWVESDKGRGSQFHFTIPYEIVHSDTVISNLLAKKENDYVDQLRGIRVLLVEDNQFNAVVAQEELEDAIDDVKIELAENGAIAVEKMKSSAFDIILMDVQMPKMNGYEATKAIRELQKEKSSTPIIAMTANVLKEEVDLCYKAGMDDFIGKPFDTTELINKIYNLYKS